MFDNARCKMGLAGLGFLALAATIASVVSCGGAPTPFPVNGPGGVGDEAPTITITSPNDANLAIAQGVPFPIEWDDKDRDSNATISFRLIEVDNPPDRPQREVILVSGISENDTGANPDSQNAETSLVPIGSYNLLGVIEDGVNAPVTSFATVTGSATQRVIIQIVGEGQGQLSIPPVVAVIEPRFDRSVTQGDQVNIIVRPTPASPEPPLPASPSYDPDSKTTLFILLDRDQDPENDDPFNPDPNQIILLQDPLEEIGAATTAQFAFPIDIDLNQIPSNPNGDPYFVRATITDGQNRPAHSYAPGTLNVVQLASGTVDLFSVGRNTSGAKIHGFNPGANLGSTVRGVTDFDADGVDDFIMVAQFGNPQNAGPVGEAYMLYGQNQVRFGGTISSNSIGQPFLPGSQTLSGVVFQAPPVRSCSAADLRDLTAGFPVRCVVDAGLARTDGISDVDIIRDITGDGRPELLFGLRHVHGAYDSTDFDPADENDPDLGDHYCYSDGIVNDFTDAVPDRNGATDLGFYAGGMAVIVNSTNRDTAGFPNVDRLESTAVSLEFVGQLGTKPLDGAGFNAFGNIFPRADNRDQPTDTDEAGRIAGGRLIGGFFDWVHNLAPPREDWFGANVSSISDLTSDGVDEIIVSSPRNERFQSDFANSAPSLFLSPDRYTVHQGSLTVFPGQNYNLTDDRAINDESGASVTPFLDHHVFPPFGACVVEAAGEVGGFAFESRDFVVRTQSFDIFAEDIDDFLGGGKSAGDFNQDGLGDILCSAPRNDRSASSPDSGTVYIIYGRQLFGEVRLGEADDPVLRLPMLRVRGIRSGDQLGLKQAAGLDVNGDRFDDVIIASARTDFGGVTRSQCIGDYNRDGQADSNDLSQVSFSDCQARFGTSVFTSDACKAFDYDNDADIDNDDRCVFCCLSGVCSVDSACINGKNSGSCCENMVDNGFVAVVFGGRTIDGDRDFSQIAKSDLPGVKFYGGQANDLVGWDVSSAGDFNQDGFGDILIAAPGEIRRDSAGRERLGVVYLVFGGTHLYNTEWNLSDPDRGVGSVSLPGIVFVSPYTKGRPNEAAPTAVGFIGDINNDGFGDIAIGNPRADFMDQTFPQGPDAPGDDAAAGRRSDAGEVYVIYGNNFGSNR